jgi:hypothetical protein
MKYVIGDDEVAFLLKPCAFDKRGRWTGEMNTGLVVGQVKLLSTDDVSRVVNLATLMGAFLELAQHDDELYNAVEEHRNDLIGLEYNLQQEESPLYEKVEGTDGKVLKLTRFTKTQGNA